MKVLQIIDTAYRATIEEQDDTIVWITHALKGAGADLNVLLRGNAVNYAVEGQDASGLRFGDWQQSEPPTIDTDVAGLVGKGIEVYVVEEDVTQRGLGNAAFVDGIKRLPLKDVPGLFESHDQVWHW